MTVIKIEVTCSFGAVKETAILEVEVEDDASEEEIEEDCSYECREWALNMVEFGWSLL